MSEDKLLKDKTRENIILFLAIASSLFLITVSMVSGLVEIDNTYYPSSINEGDPLYISFSAGTDLDSEISYKIYKGDELVSSTNDYSLELDYSSSGNYEFTFYAQDNESNDTQSISIDVMDVPLSINMLSPASGYRNNRTILIDLTLDREADSCTYNFSNLMSGSLLGSGQEFSNTIALPSDGSYGLTVKCSNMFENASKYVSFTIDTFVPAITSKSATVNTDNSVTLAATTDMVCACRYDSIDREFDQMSNSFENTNNIQHHSNIGSLGDGTYTYYMRCKSTGGNVASMQSVTFTILRKPTASISLDTDKPLKAGTYEVHLTTSEQVVSAPSLYYNFNTNTNNVYVTLTGSGNSWNGYLIIDESSPNSIGTFYYSGVDMNNNVGNEITHGQLFLVDTTKPTAPISIEAEPEYNGDIRIKWYYDGEEVTRYNIYRSVGDDVEYVDYFDSTTSKQYIDEDTVDGITYYYRMAAVDEAGNDGELSSIVQATSARRISNSNNGNTYNDNSNNDDVQVQQQEFLDKALIPKIDQFIAEGTSYLADIDNAKNEIDAINDPAKLKIINLLKLSSQIETAKTSIQGTMDEADSLKNQQISASEFEVKLNKLKMDAIKFKALVPEDIMVTEQSSYDQVTQGSDVDMAISEVVTVNLSRNILNDYSLKNKKMQDEIVVNTEILIFKIKYVGKDDYEKYTLVKKVVSSASTLENISIIEIIPKSFESDASGLNFVFEDQQAPQIVKSDPVLRWDSDSFTSQTIYYMINNHAEMSAAKDTKTIVITRPDFKVSDTISDGGKSKLTGFVGLEFAKFELSPIHWMIILGLAAIVGLGAYYMSLDKKNSYELQGPNAPAALSGGLADGSSGKKKSSLSSSLSSAISKISLSSNISKGNASSISHSHAINPSAHQHKSLHNQKAQVKTPANMSIPMHEDRLRKADDPMPDGHEPVIHRSVGMFNESTHSFEYMSKQLDGANFLINMFDYEKSRVIFNHCMNYYKNHSFSSEYEKKEFKSMIDHMYMKLTAYRLVHASRKSKKGSSKESIDTIHAICKKLYDSLDNVSDEYRQDELKFIDYIHSSSLHIKRH